MIKKLIFPVALLTLTVAPLTPRLAYSQTQSPSASFTSQVVPAGSDPPCQYGPNYAGSIPGPAQKAGYTTCYANYDFSTSYMDTLSNWLDCAGASPALWYNTGYLSNKSPCGRYTIVSDVVNGVTQNVLDMAYTNTDASNGATGTWMNTVCGQSAPCNTGAGSGIWPVFGYYEITLEVLPANTNVFAAWQGANPSVYVEDMDYFGVVANNSKFIEYDTIEVTANNGSPYSGTANVGYGPNNGPGNFSGVPTFTYHNYANLVTSNGSATYDCAYLNGGSPNGCNSIGQPDAGSLYTQWGVGPSSGNSPCAGGGHGACPSLSQDLHVRISSIRVFTCATWATAPCHETPITSP